MRLRSVLLRLAGNRPTVEVVQTAGGPPVVISDEPDATREARRLLLDADVASDFAIGIVPDAHPRVLAEMARLQDEGE